VIYQGWTLEYTSRIKLDDAERLIEAAKYFKPSSRKKSMGPKEQAAFEKRARERLKAEKARRQHG